MVINYANNKIERICHDSKYANKIFPQIVVEKLGKLMYYLSAYDSIDYFYKLNVLKKYKVHELQGDKKGILSLALDYSYRMELRVIVENKEGQDVIKILEVTNHYGD